MSLVFLILRLHITVGTVRQDTAFKYIVMEIRDFDLKSAVSVSTNFGSQVQKNRYTATLYM